MADIDYSSGARIFISYSRNDQTFAVRLADSLSGLGARVWIDLEDIQPGINWSSAIQEGLDSCDLMIIVISPDSMSSINVENEWQYYFDRKKPIIPVLLRHTDVHYQLRRLQYIDFHRQQYDLALRQLYAHLKEQGFQIASPSADATHERIPENQRPLQVRPETTHEKHAASSQRKSGNRGGLFVVSAVALALVIGIVVIFGQMQRDSNEDSSANLITIPETTVADIGANLITNNATDTDTPVPQTADSETLTPTQHSDSFSVPAPTISPAPTIAPTTTTQAPEEVFRSPALPNPTPSETPTLPAESPSDLHLFVDTFEDNAALSNWIYTSPTWQVISRNGNHILQGRGSLEEPIGILENANPWWLASDARDLVIRFRVLLSRDSVGARLVFRYSDEGYYALEFFPGTITLKRNNDHAPDVTNRDHELVIKIIRNLPLDVSNWHDVTVWTLNNDVIVYLDQNQVMDEEDPFVRSYGPLGAGQILFQVMNTAYTASFDDLVVHRAEDVSTNFDDGVIPSTWDYQGTFNVSLNASTSPIYLRLHNSVEVELANRAIDNLQLHCQIQNVQGGYRLLLRKSDAGLLMLDFSLGNLSIEKYDSSGIQIWSYSIHNFYAYKQWDTLSIEYITNHLIIYRNGVQRFDDIIPGTVDAGVIAFQTQTGDDLYIDNCLLESAAP